MANQAPTRATVYCWYVPYMAIYPGLHFLRGSSEEKTMLPGIKEYTNEDPRGP